VGLKLIAVSEQLARTHYAEHEGKPFHASLIEYITSGPVVVMAVEGPEAVAVVRASVGETHPLKATPGSIRADFGLMIGRNLIHASDKPESAQRELALWFEAGELLTYGRELDRWILEG
jgi:nucleoside-diphosphate kinase